MKIKALIIAMAFLICLAILLSVRFVTAGSYAIHQVDFYDNGSDWRNYRLVGLSFDSDSSRVMIDSTRADLSSPIYKTKFPFNELILCWNCYAGDSNGLSIDIFISDDSISWYEFAYQDWRRESVIGALNEDSLPRKKIPGVGYVDTDIIKCEKPVNYYRFSIQFSHIDSIPMYLDRISVCYSNTKANIRQFGIRGNRKSGSIPIVSLAVPFFAQGDLPDSIANSTCSPTSLTMALNYHNHQYSSLEVCAAVYDPFAGIYGNWPYNIETAYLLGLQKTWIGRHNSFNEIADEINSGKPVIIGIDVSPGELPGAPYSTTNGAGHLIVVRGFDNKGNVLVNDPAGDNPQQGMVAYDMKTLTKIWVEHGGVAYHLWPEP